MQNKIPEDWVSVVLSPGRLWALDIGRTALRLPSRGHAEGEGQPVKWLIDQNNNCWYAAEGTSLRAVPSVELGNLVTAHDRFKVAQILDSKPPAPVWAKEALALGWSPPPD